MSQTMIIKERLIHTALFELGAVVGLVSIAMVWNLLFNIGFDKIFTAPRELRSLGVRVLNAIGFKLGLMLTTVPVMMILFELSLWQAVGADMVLTVGIMIYALMFNWIYDKVRLKVA